MTDSAQTPEKRPWLHRGRLRDVVLVLCVMSSLVYPLNTATLAGGLILLAVGSALHLLAKGQLVRNVTLSRDGAYAVVRHPYYLANYLIDTSFCLLSGNVFLVLLYPVLFFWAYGPTLSHEESLLASLHGDAFTAHCDAVPRIFPGPASVRALKTIARGFSWQRVTRQEVKRICRFACLGMLLPLVHQTAAGGLDELLFWQSRNLKVAVLLILGVTFLLASLVVAARGRGGTPRGES